MRPLVGVRVRMAARASRMYGLIKYVHVTTVVLSLAGFCLRGFLVIRNSPILSSRWIKVMPHVNDTILLAAALSLAFMADQLPFVANWVTAKVLGVMVYIILGSLALRPGSSRSTRIVCLFAAILVFGWIASVALTRQPMGFLVALA